MGWERQVCIKTKDELAIMREAGIINAEALKAASEACVPGASTYDVNAAADKVLEKYHVVSAFKGVQGPTPYPTSTCVSVNNILVHGIPSKNIILKEGDIVSVDCGATLKGYVADSAFTINVGNLSDENWNLLKSTEGSLYEGILQMVPGNYAGDISAAIQNFAESRGFMLTQDYTGHGVGRSMWEAPQVPNVGKPKTGLKLRAGMTIAIEPMLMIGTEKTKVLKDGWSVSSVNKKNTGHFEHTIAVTEDGPMIMTLLDNGQPPVVIDPANKAKVLGM